MNRVKRIEELYGITWDRLVELEPRLESLLVDARASRPDRRSGRNYEIAWGELKDPIATLVGFHRIDDCDPALKTRAAYEVAYTKLLEELHGR
jgi:hypothetical protein